MSWTKLKKRVSTTVLAENLRKRVDFHCAVYPDEQSRLWITFDGKEIKISQWYFILFKKYL